MGGIRHGSTSVHATACVVINETVGERESGEDTDCDGVLETGEEINDSNGFEVLISGSNNDHLIGNGDAETFIGQVETMSSTATVERTPTAGRPRPVRSRSTPRPERQPATAMTRGPISKSWTAR